MIFLATADEEGVGAGAAFMLERFPDKLDVEYVLNEGGLGVQDAVKPGQVLFAVAAGEKGFADLRMIARGEPGHASFPDEDAATARPVGALAHVESIEHALVFHEYMEPLFVRLGAHEHGVRGFLMRHPRLMAGSLLSRFAASADTRATVSDTCVVTKIEAGAGNSTIPGHAEAWLDCRLLPGMGPAAWRDRMQTEVASFSVEVEVASGWAGTTSPWDTELARALEKHLPVDIPGSVAVPIMSAAWTDSRFFRARGAVAYGIFPFVVTRDQAAGIHGNDERLDVEELGRGVHRTYRVLIEMAARRGP